MNRVANLTHILAAMGLSVLIASPAVSALSRQDDDAAASQPEVAAADLPKAEEILEKAVAAMGGKDAIEKIESSHTKATMVTPMGNMELESYWTKTGKVLLHQAFPGMGEGSTGTDGEVAWTMNPMTGGYQLLGDDDMANMQEQSNMHLSLLDFDGRFETIETVGIEDFDGRSCHKVRMVEKIEETEDDEAPAQKPAESMMFFDIENGLLLGFEESGEGQMGPTTVTISLKDWKETGDLKLFHQMIIDQMGMQMEMNFSVIELNNVDDAIFDLPEEVVKLVEAEAAAATQPDEDEAHEDDSDEDGHEHDDDTDGG